MHLDSHFTGKKAELDNPAVQTFDYQESVVPDANNVDLLNYAEDWGGQQLNVAPQINGDLENDPAISLSQGDRPELDSDFYTQPNKSAGENPPDAAQWGAPWGEQESRPAVQGVGGIDTTTDGQKTLSKGLGQNGPDVGDDQPPFPAGYTADADAMMGDPWNSPAGPGIVQASSLFNGEAHMDIEAAIKLASAKLNPLSPETQMMEDTFRRLASSESVLNVVSEPVALAASIKADTENVIKIASFEDLFSFDRVSHNQLVHKSSKDLWRVATDEEGNLIIAREFDASGAPIKG